MNVPFVIYMILAVLVLSVIGLTIMNVFEGKTERKKIE